MSFEELLRKRAVEPVQITPREIGELLALARRDLRTAESLVSIDLDWAFVVAYNSILQLSIAYMNWLGFRPRGEGKHYNTFRFMEEALPEDQAMMERLQKLRRKRNMAVYDRAGLVGAKEAVDVVEFAGRYYARIESELPREITVVAADEESE
jgi:hypothetical protein